MKIRFSPTEPIQDTSEYSVEVWRKHNLRVFKANDERKEGERKSRRNYWIAGSIAAAILAALTLI